MGAIFAVIPRNGATGAIGLAEEAFRRAAARSPYRGVPASITLPQGVLGIQALGEDASLGSEGPWHVALHGWISNWDDLAQRFSLQWPPTATPARRFALAYAKWGEAFLKAARGEFSAIAVDTRDGDVSAIRGHLGTKPLFYSQSDTLLVIATEIRQAMAGCGRVAPLNKGVLIELLAGVSLAREDTCWQGVNRVMAAHVAHFTDGERRGMTRYWLPLAPDRYPKRSLDDLAEEASGLMFQAVERSLPNAPYGVAMSGGLDSTMVWALSQALASRGLHKAECGTPISMVFPRDPHCDESVYIDAMLTHTGSVGLKINASNFDPLDFLHEQTKSLDAPVSGTLYHNDMLAAGLRKQGASVLLLGVGGDEWFQGSFKTLADDFFGGHLIRGIRDSMTFAIPSGVSRLRFLWHRAIRPQLGLKSLIGTMWGPKWLSESARKLLTTRLAEPRLSSVPHPSKAVKQLYEVLIDLYGGEADEIIEPRAAVLGCDIRNPLLDVDLAEFAFSVDPRAHRADGQTKHLMRRVAQNYLPEVVRLRLDKTVFDSNFTQAVLTVVGRGWLPGNGALAREGLLNPVVVDNLAVEFSKRKRSNVFLWDLYCMERFASCWSEGL